MIRLSVIIPVYNAEKYICQTLDSVLSQSLSDLEVICVDDGSTDSSLSILNSYSQKDERVRVISQKNEYAGSARNKGIAIARGKYIHFLDADDYVLPYSYQAVCDKAEHYDLDLLKFRGVGYDEASQSYVRMRDYVMEHIPDAEFMQPIDLSSSRRLVNMTYTVWTGIYRTDFLKENGIEFNNLICVNDRSFSTWVSLLAKKVMLSRDVVVVHRTNMSGSLVGRRSSHFDCQFRSMDITRDILDKVNADSDTYDLVMTSEVEDLLYWCRRYSVDSISENSEKILKDTGKYLRENAPQCCREYAVDQWRAICADSLKDKANREKQQAVIYPFFRKKREEPLFSIIIPVTDDDLSLEETLYSLYRQRMENLQIIAVCGSDKTRSLTILHKYQYFDNRIEIIESDLDDEQLHAEAIRHAIGKYGLILPVGDELTMDCLKTVSEHLDEDVREVNVGHYLLFDEHDGRYHLSRQKQISHQLFFIGNDETKQRTVDIPEPLYIQHVEKSAERMIEVIDADILNNSQLNKAITEAKAPYVLLARKGYECLDEPAERLLANRPQILILNSRVKSEDAHGVYYRGLWKDKTAGYFSLLNSFKPDEDMIYDLAGGGLANKIFQRQFLLENGLMLAEDEADGDEPFVIRALRMADKVEFTDEQLCQITFEKTEKASAAELIKGFEKLLKENETPQLRHYVIERLTESLKSSSDLERDLKAASRLLGDDRNCDAISYLKEMIDRDEKQIDLQKARYEELLQLKVLDAARLKTAYDEKSELNGRLQQTYTEKSELNARLQQTYKEKSEINAKLQQTYKEKSEINRQLKQARDELAQIKNSRSYKVAETLAYLPRKIRGNSK